MKRYVIYNCCHVRLSDEVIRKPWLIENDMKFIYNKTDNVYVRIPWSQPTPRDLQSFVKGYQFGIGKVVEFETLDFDL